MIQHNGSSVVELNSHYRQSYEAVLIAKIGDEAARLDEKGEVG